jgi:hypothetical protein
MCLQVITRVQAQLEAYLECKRVAFPRLYFLSNDELLHLLSQGNNPRAVQPHLQKLFDGIHTLEFEGEGRNLDVLAMHSSELERISLGSTLKARGAVEGMFACSNDARLYPVLLIGSIYVCGLQKSRSVYSEAAAQCDRRRLSQKCSFGAKVAHAANATNNGTAC